nr:flagellar filament capping protein FliD [Rossellomorea vietnamensis]
MTKTISVSDPSVVSVKNINSTTDFSGTLEVGNLAKSATTISGVTGITDSSKTIKDLMGLTGTQKINIKSVLKDGTLDPKGISIEFDPEKETLNSLISKINQQSGVSVFFDEKSQKFSFTAKNSGDATGNDIALSDETGTFFDSLQLTDTNFSGVRQEGVNATFTYNGLTTTRPSNTFTINGFELTLKNESTGPVNFTSAPDTDKILEKLVKFVDEYNKLIEKVNGEVNEKKYRDFQPLTAEQKESMEEKEIELWEEKSRSGTLRNDSVLSSGLNKMRTDMYTPISGGTSGIDQLAQIGIKTSSNYLDRGKLIIDENKLKEAISKDPNTIYEIFAKDGVTSNEQGIARRLRDTLKDTMDSIEQKAGKASSTNNTFTLGRLLNNMDSQMDRFEDRLNQVEDRYWRQFTAMEKAIQRSNEQSMFLMNQFGG